MNKIEYVEADLFEYIKDIDGPIIIPHVCNDKGGFGSGFVVPLAQNFPRVKEQYLAWKEGNAENYDPFELGQVQFVYLSPTPLIVANMIAQTLGGIRPLYYNHLSTCIDKVARGALQYNARIIAPLFGSGLAGGDFNFIEQLAIDSWAKRDIQVTFCYFEHTRPQNWTPPNG